MKRKNKKLYVHAYCQLNLGDDLLIKILAERYPEQSFYVFCNPNKNRAIKSMPNTKVTSYFYWVIYSLLLRMHIIKHGYGNFFKRKMSDAVVRIGGSIFMEIPGWRNDFCPHFLSKKIFYINCNFGPYKTEDYFRFVEKKISEAQDCCFRDFASYKLFVTNNNVRVAPDIGFLTKIPDGNCEKKTIIVSVIEVEERGLWNYYKLIAEFCDQMIRDGYKVKLMSFCEHEGDVKAVNKICRLSELNNKLEMYNYQGDLDEAIRIFNSGNYVVASRFHALILGWKFCKKVFPIVYSDKQLNVMKDIGFEGHYMDLRNGNDYSVSDIRAGCLNNPIIDISDVTKKAELQFEAFDKYIFK